MNIAYCIPWRPWASLLPVGVPCCHHLVLLSVQHCGCSVPHFPCTLLRQNWTIIRNVSLFKPSWHTAPLWACALSLRCSRSRWWRRSPLSLCEGRGRWSPSLKVYIMSKLSILHKFTHHQNEVMCILLKYHKRCVCRARAQNTKTEVQHTLFAAQWVL